MSGALSTLNAGLNQTTNVVRGIGSLATSVGALANSLGLGGFGVGGVYGLPNPGLGLWAQGLQPGSFRGLGFAATMTQVRRGRRVVVHEYPYRDDVWVEDLGRGTRTITFRGFITGDTVYAQRDAFLAAVEMKGPATLVHPSLGSISCVLTECSAAERSELGRVVELEFTFIESKLSLPAATPALVSPTPATTGFLSSFASNVQSGLSATQQAVATVGSYVNRAVAVVGSADMVANSVAGLVGNFGRYSSGSRSGLQAASATVGSALSTVVSARSLVFATGATANALAGLL